MDYLVSTKVSDRITIGNKRSCDAPIKYALPKQKINLSKAIAFPSNVVAHATTSCGCSAEKTYTNVYIKISEKDNDKVCEPQYTRKVTKTDPMATPIIQKLLNGTGNCVAFNFCGKCGHCNHYVQRGFIREATSEIDRLKSLINCDNADIHLVSEMYISALKQRLPPTHNSLISEHHSHKMLIGRTGEGKINKNEYNTEVSVPRYKTNNRWNEDDLPKQMIPDKERVEVTDGYGAVPMDIVQINVENESERENNIYAINKCVFHPNTPENDAISRNYQETCHTTESVIEICNTYLQALQEGSDKTEQSVVDNIKTVDESFNVVTNTSAQSGKVQLTSGEEEEEDSTCRLRDPSTMNLIDHILSREDFYNSSIMNELNHLVSENISTPLVTHAKGKYAHLSINISENDYLIPKIENIISLDGPCDSGVVTKERLLMKTKSNTSYSSVDILPNETQRSRTSSIDSNGDHCRVCHCSGDEVLISPCNCNGSLKFVHESCLITWMKSPFKEACEICKKKILIVKKSRPILTWKKPLQRPTPLVWVIVFTTAICVNLMSVVKDATRKCMSTSCIIFYVIGTVGIILASMFLYFWVKRVKVFWESWKVQNEHWVVKIDEELGKVV